MKENSIEEEIKIALDKFLDNKDKDSAILIVEKFILGNYILIRGGRTNIVKDSLRYILSDYKRVLKENEELKNAINVVNKEKADWIRAYQEEKDKQLLKSSIPVQKVKDKIRKNEEIIDISNDGDLIHELFQKNKVYEELLESEE